MSWRSPTNGKRERAISFLCPLEQKLNWSLPCWPGPSGARAAYGQQPVPQTPIAPILQIMQIMIILIYIYMQIYWHGYVCKDAIDRTFRSNLWNWKVRFTFRPFSNLFQNEEQRVQCLISWRWSHIYPLDHSRRINNPLNNSGLFKNKKIQFVWKFVPTSTIQQQLYYQRLI